jgi:hypothetical protein
MIFLTLALGLDTQEITEFTAMSESEAQELKISVAGTHHDGSVFLLSKPKNPLFRVCESAFI